MMLIRCQESHKCTLILTEGDSKPFLLHYYGVFPLRGKFLNVRDAPKSTWLIIKSSLT